VPPRSAPPRAHTREGSLLSLPAGDGEPEAVEGGTDVERAYLASAPALQRPATEAEDAPYEPPPEEVYGDAEQDGDDAVPATPAQEAEYRRLAEKWAAP